MDRILRRARVLPAVIVALLTLVALAGPVAAHGRPLPDQACNQGTERAFLDIEASVAVPMWMTTEGYCMTMYADLRPE